MHRIAGGEVKALLGQMLGMEQTVALGAKANSVTKELKPHLNATQDVIARLLRDRPNLDSYSSNTQQQQAQLEIPCTISRTAQQAARQST